MVHNVSHVTIQIDEKVRRIIEYTYYIPLCFRSFIWLQTNQINQIQFLN